MRLLHTLVTAAAISALTIAPGMAQTPPDYIFNVPVNIDNVPALNGHSFMVECQVQTLGADGHVSGYGSNAGLARVPTYDIGPTGYHGTIRAEVRLPAGVRRADALRWNCSARFFTVTNAAGERVSLTSESQYTPLTGQAVARSQLLVQANFPRP